MKLINKYIYHIAAIMVALICGLFLWSTCSVEETEGDNISALLDSVNIYKMKNGELLHYKAIYEGKNLELTSLLDQDKKYIKELESKVGHIRTVTKVRSEVRVDTVKTVLTDTIIAGDTAVVAKKFAYENRWVSLNGYIYKDSISIDHISLPVDLTIVQGKKVGVISSNPYIYIKDIKSARESTSRWSLGITAGAGVTWDGHKFEYGPSINVGLTYRLF